MEDYEKMKIINEVMITAEVAERWRISIETVKKSYQDQKGNPPKFTKEECGKSDP